MGKNRFITVAAVLLVGVTTTACFSHVSFDDADNTGVRQQRLSVSQITMRTGEGTTDGVQGWDQLPVSNAAQTTIETMCRPTGVEKIGTEVVSVLVAGSQYLAERYIETQRAKLAEIRKAVQATYSRGIVTTAAKLREAHCLVLVRRDQNPSSTAPNGLEAVLRVVPHPNDELATASGFTLDPLYVRMTNAVAASQVPEEGQSYPQIEVSIAASVAVLANRPPAGLPGLVALGREATTITQVPVGLDAGPVTQGSAGGRLAPTGFIPFPPNDGEDTAVEFRVAVTETGNPGFDPEVRAGRLTALEAVLPTAIKELIQAQKDDDE